MKSYEEMAKCVFERRDKELAAKKKRIKVIERYASLAACMSLAVVLGYKAFDQMNNIPRSEFINEGSESIIVTDMPDNTNETTIKTETGNTETSVQHTTEAHNPAQTATAQSTSAKPASETAETHTKVSSAANTRVSSAVTTKPAVTSAPKTAVTANTRKTVKTTLIYTERPAATTVKKTDTAPGNTDTTIPCLITIVPETVHYPGDESTEIDDKMIAENFNHFSHNGTIYALRIPESTEMNVPTCSYDEVGELITNISVKGNNTSLTLNASVYLINDYSEDYALAVRFQGGQKYYMFTPN